jgi:preprotein translocase subunit SecB
MAEEDQAAQQTDQPERQIKTQKVYLKDVSFETPNSPQIFGMDWKPDLTIDFSSAFQSVGEDHYEVILTLTVTAKVEDKTAYLAEVHQAGVFLITGFEEEDLQRALNVPCMRLIYPYAGAASPRLVSSRSTDNACNRHRIKNRHLPLKNRRQDKDGSGMTAP